MGLTVLPSQANFLAIGFGRDAKPIHQGLLEQGVIVRPLASYDLPQFLRVTVGTQAENDRFVQALKTVLKSRSDERSVGKGCGSTCRSRWSPEHEKKKKKKNT